MPTKSLIPNSFLKEFSSSGSALKSSRSFFEKGFTSLYQSLIKIRPEESRNELTASINLQAGFLIITARLECASIFDSSLINST